jgi:Holliday junction resolvasome RuvABC DNA-binding subunit
VVGENDAIARRLEEAAQMLAEQRANPWRVRAYERAAQTVRELGEPVSRLIEMRGRSALLELPGVGVSLASAIEQLAKTGRLPLLERLRQEADPLDLLASVPGIGQRTAARIHDLLGIDTLEELEVAAHDERLATVVGLGPKRIAGVRDALAGRLARVRRSFDQAHRELPEVAELLDVDAEYRRAAERGELPKIAPRRFNPRHEAWLPILHTQRGERHYTALFSNTARAHEAGRTRDWVVLYFDGFEGERQCTVVTAMRGALRGRRVVRGREEECAKLYGLPASRGARR